MDLSDITTIKHSITKYIQGIYDDNLRLQEVNQQLKSEITLNDRNNITLIRNHELKIKESDEILKNKEDEILKRKKQMNDYEIMIRNLEDKINELLTEKKEEDRFNIVKVQANMIHEKELEIERLESLLDKKKNNSTKIKNIIESVENETNNNSEISIIEEVVVEDKDEEQNEELVVEDKEEDNEEDDEESEDDYEILTYRKKEFWIKKNDNPISVYEIIGDDELGEKVGTYIKGKNDKMKVVLNKK